MNTRGIMLVSCAIIGDSDENSPTPGVGKRHNLTGQGNRIGHISLELMAAVLTTASNFEEFYCFQIS